MTKVSSHPPLCAILLPGKTNDTFEILHDPETGQITLITGSGTFSGTLDENNCTTASACLHDPLLFCSSGCTYTFAGCFSDGNPATVEGSATIESHSSDGGPCGGDVDCTVFYDVSGYRVE
jgi:hypothetical protein